MQSTDSPHHNEARPPIFNNFCYGVSEVMLPPMAANSVTPEEGYLHQDIHDTNHESSSLFTASRATIKANNPSATNTRVYTTTFAHNAKRKLSTCAILDDDMLSLDSLDISDEEIYSFMDDAMHQDDDILVASSEGVDHKSQPSQGETCDIDARVQRQEAILITVMQKSAESRAAVQRLGILSSERLNYARKMLQGVELPSLASTTHLLSRNEMPSSSRCNNKDDAMSYDSIIAAARMVVDNK